MPRPPRLHIPGAIYHVTLRGNHRQRIFRCEADYFFLESVLSEVITDHRLRLHAYCWMPNHLHLAIEVSDQPLARPMQRLASRYARRYQARLETTGHLFERRYHAVVVDTDRYLLALVRYIHLNPVRAALTARPEDYRWSSYRAYVSDDGPDWLTTSAVLDRLSAERPEARRTLAAFMREMPSPEEYGYLRRRPSRREADAPSASGPASSPRADADALAKIVREECERVGVAAADVTVGLRGRLHSLARARIAWRALRSGAGGTLAEMAPKLGKSAAALSECLRSARRRRPELFRET